MMSIGLLMLASLVAITLFGTLIAPYNPSETSADSLAGPTAAHWLGTDSIGRDLLSRLIVGGRTTLLITFVAVTLAVCERRGEAGVWWRGLSRYGEAVEEAHTILTSLRLDHVERTITKELAYGQQRLLEIALALATKPKVLLLDEPAAGVPKDESGDLFAAIDGLSRDLSILFIEHDMNLVFRFASRIIVMVSGRILVEGTPAQIASDPRVREVYLGKARHG